MKADQLKYLSLCDNEIGAEGCLHLTKAKWPKLDKLNLSKIGKTKIEIILEMKDVPILRK